MPDASSIDAHPAAADRRHLAARIALLKKEKELNELRDALAAERRALPAVPVTKDYRFETAEGQKSFADLFAGRSQLLVQHFMFDPDWEAGCKSCSFWTDGFDLAQPHLAARDTTLVTVARAPWPKLAAFTKRMGWRGTWASSHGSDFNRDFGVSFDEAEREAGTSIYNYRRTSFPASEGPGLSSFSRSADGTIRYHYSTFARGLDPLNPVYQLLDLTAKGRDEGGRNMAWLKLRDQY